MLTFLNNPIENLSQAGSSIKLSEHKPKEFLLNIAARLRKENESGRAREQAQTIYQMCRRHRGQTPNDLFAYWREGVWCESPIYAQLHGTNVFQALIRGAEANFNQADIKLDITANRNNAETRSTVKIARRIYEILKERQWTESARQTAFYANILMLNAFFISRFDKSKGQNIPVPQFSPTAYEESGTYVCPECYGTGAYGQNTEGCEICGYETLSVLDEPQTVQDFLVEDFSPQPSGETEMVVADGLDVSIDPDGRPADIKSCRWVEWRVLVHKNELKRLYPHLKLESKTDWSYQTRLKMGLKRYSSGEGYPESETDKSTYELRQIWLDLAEYEDYAPPVDFKVGRFAFKKGVPLKQQCPDGLVFGVSNNELAFVDAENKNKRISASLWLSDGVSFTGLGAKAGLLIQKKINVLDNMTMEGEARSLKGSVIYNPAAVDGSSLEGANTNIPLKTDYAFDDKGMSNVVMPLQVEGLSQSSLIYLSSQRQTMQEVMGVPDVAIGQNTDGDDTFGGQALRARKASGLLVPATQSLARAMELWCGHQLDLIQNFGSPESLLAFGSTYGEEWDRDEIEAFFNADLEKDIAISYVPGSEIPETRFEKQMRLRQDIGAGFVTLTPELQSQMAKESGFDLDINGYDSNRKLFDTRWNAIKEGVDPQVEEMYRILESQMMTENGRMTDQTGNPLPNPVLSEILNRFPVYAQAENHVLMREFWSVKVRELAASGQTGLLLAIADAMITKHSQSQFELLAKEGALQGLAGLPGAAVPKMLEGVNDETASN